MDLALEIKNLNLNISGKQILENISFEIKKGGICSIIGENGSGKTSLVRCILGLEKYKSGSIFLSSKNIGYIPQKIDLDKSTPFSVFDILSVFSGKKEKEILEKLKIVKCEDFIHSKISNLSGGQFQRVLIANFLLLEKEILIFDEAISGVDMNGIKVFYDLIFSLNKEKNITIILVSHDLNNVFSKSSKIISLKNGKICCTGKPLEVSNSQSFKDSFGDYFGSYLHFHK